MANDCSKSLFCNHVTCQFCPLKRSVCQGIHFCVKKHTCPMLHIFLSAHRTMCPVDQILIGHGLLMMQKQQDTRKQHMWLWTKQEKLKFTSLTVSPEKAAVKWPLIMNLLSVQLLSLQRMRFDRALNITTYFSQNIVPLQSRCTGQHICLLHWTKTWIFLVNNSRLVRGTEKRWDMRPSELCFNQTKVLRGVPTICL